jgi:transcription factor WhiB
MNGGIVALHSDLGVPEGDIAAVATAATAGILVRCRRRRQLFFPPKDRPGDEARQLCAACPVQDQCLAYSLIADEPFGIWGGLETDERQALRRHLQRRGELPSPASDSAA